MLQLICCGGGAPLRVEGLMRMKAFIFLVVVVVVVVVVSQTNQHR